MAKSAHTGSVSEHTALKRRKTDDDDSSNPQSKKARTRVSFSCGECHRRKQKVVEMLYIPEGMLMIFLQCDRQIPCSHCVSRKVPDLCKAYTPGKTDQDISVRLARLEQIIELALPQYFHGSASPPAVPSDRHNRTGSEGPDEDNRSFTDDQDPSGGTFQGGRWYGNSASGSVAPASVLEQLANVVVTSSRQEQWDPTHYNAGHNAASTGQNGTHSVEHTTALATPALIESVRQDSEPSAADNLKSLVQECGVSPHKISELLQELPPQRFSDVLIDHYFASM
ncbi:hypothetical protein J3R82DRAFT_4537 [Butyriboletus roseoflavus]|nr:hypothetical protein J3R82DRAFT_4537 [Butyriboletus roseoflavus]